MSPSAKYRLLRSTDSTANGADLTGLIAATSHIDATAVPGTLYFYRVIGVLPDGKQSPSAAARFTLVWPTPLDLPSGRNPAPTPPATATKKP